MVEKLLTKLRGKDDRAAYRAIPALCRLNDASLASIVASYKPKDEQRRFQLELARIALADGIGGLTKQWLRVGTEEQRRVLLQEIGMDWDPQWHAEIAIAALEEPDDNVRGYAVLCAKHAAQRGLDPGQRARITQGLIRAMARYDEHPMQLFWLEHYVELLGLTANASDGPVIARLEGLRPFAGASRRTTMEKLDPDNLPFPYPKGDLPAGVPKPVYRMWDRGTGLLEIKLLESALKHIRARR
jgi:hypothetical protein